MSHSSRGEYGDLAAKKNARQNVGNSNEQSNQHSGRDSNQNSFNQVIWNLAHGASNITIFFAVLIVVVVVIVGTAVPLSILLHKPSES